MAGDYLTMAFSIDTERLSLRLRTKDDAECNLELLREHDGGTTLSIGEVEQRMVERNIEAQAEGFGILGIRRRNEERSIGYCGLIVGRASFDEPEMAYEILPGFRGHGYATEAAGAVIEAAFATGRERIWATVGSWNAPSFRVLEKNGFSAHHRDTGKNGEFVWMVRNAPA
jgi:RimJ/RimL family protein N-acetyltransferase